MHLHVASQGAQGTQGIQGIQGIQGADASDVAAQGAQGTTGSNTIAISTAGGSVGNASSLLLKGPGLSTATFNSVQERQKYSSKVVVDLPYS